MNAGSERHRQEVKSRALLKAEEIITFPCEWERNQCAGALCGGTEQSQARRWFPLCRGWRPGPAPARREARGRRLSSRTGPAAGHPLLSGSVRQGPTQAGPLPLNPPPDLPAPGETPAQHDQETQNLCDSKARFLSCFKHLTSPNCSLRFSALSEASYSLGDP